MRIKDKEFELFLKELGKVIQEKREAAGLTQEEMDNEPYCIDYKYYQKIEYGKKDDDDNLILNDNRWVIFDENIKETAMGELEALDKEYEDVLEKRNNDIQEYNEILEEEVEIDLATVSIDNIPEEIGANILLMKMLLPMVEV